MTSNNDEVDHEGTAAGNDDDEFDDLFNFTSPSTLTTSSNLASARTSSPIQFGLDSDSSDSEPGDSVQPSGNSNKNNVSLESSSYYEVGSSTGTSTSSADGPKEGDAIVADNMSGLLDETGATSGLTLERQGEDDFQELDEGTRDFLDWLDKPKSSTSELPSSTEKDITQDSNDDDLDFVDIHMPDKAESVTDNKRNQYDDNSITHEEMKQIHVDSTIASIPKKDEVTQNQLPRPDITTARKSSEGTSASLQHSSILTESNSIDAEDQKSTPNIAIEGDVEESDDDDSESGNEIDDLLLTEEHVEQKEEDIVFTNISEAVRSAESNIQKHILPLLKTKATVSVEDRPWLWTKVICGKILSDVKSSSIADSFLSWDQSFNLIDLEQKKALWKFGVDEKFVDKLLTEVDCLSDRIVISKRDHTEEAKNVAKRDLSSLLLFYYQSCINNNPSGANQNKMNKRTKQATAKHKIEDSKDSEFGTMEEIIVNTSEEEVTPTSADDQNEESTDEENEGKSKPRTKAVEWNSLIGPIAATLLSSSVCPSVASVMLSTIVPVAMPLVSLTTAERLDAAKKIHSTFYLLVCYHLPMLVLHLDRYCPGWHWPKLNIAEQHIKGKESDNEKRSDSPTRKGRNLEAQGIIPLTWFTSQLAGECSADGRRITTEIQSDQLLRLWDILLTSNDSSLPFFLALRILEKSSYKLLMLRGDELEKELTSVMCFQETTTAVESLMGDDENGCEDMTTHDGDSVVDVWWDHAVSMRESTPLSVLCDLQKAEDNAVKLAFQLRQKKAMDKMTLRLKQEAEKHKAAIEEKRCMKEDEVEFEYYKARLEKFYKKHCPDRIGRVDSVLKVYEGRMQILNQRLLKKYGSGFIPMFSPKLSMKTNNLMSTMGHGIRGRKKERMATLVERETMQLFGKVGIEEAVYKHRVAVNVSTSEILPFVSKVSTKKSKDAPQNSLKFYLVDSRPDEMATLQGRFPTSARLSPDDLMDPDRMQQKIDMFESLRGAVHICIMGEGFSSLMNLYDHPLSKEEERLLDDDETRTNMCALFFIKRGFPFVSVLDGGFAAAHAWLARDCKHIPISTILVDYDEELSLFAQLERSYRDQIEFANASAREKTTRVLQELIDRSMTRLTISENKIENFADNLRTEAGRREAKESVSNIFKRSAHQIKMGIEQAKRVDDLEDVKKATKAEEVKSGRDSVSSEGGSLKMRLAHLRERRRDFTVRNKNTSTTGNGMEEVQLDSSNLAPKGKEGISFKNPFGGMAKANMNSDQKKSVTDVVTDEGMTSANTVKKSLTFLSQRGISKAGDNTSIDDKKEKKRNFGFRSFQDSEAKVKSKGFEFKNINFSRFNKQQQKSQIKDASNSEPAKQTSLKLNRNPFAKKVTNADEDIEKAIAAALGGKEKQEKQSDAKPGPLREKLANLTKSASQGIKDAASAAKSTPQIKRPVLSFNKLGSVDRTQPPKSTEEESVFFENIIDQNNIERVEG